MKSLCAIIAVFALAIALTGPALAGGKGNKNTNANNAASNAGNNTGSNSGSTSTTVYRHTVKGEHLKEATITHRRAKASQ